MPRLNSLILAACVGAVATTASADRLTLSFLPPDLPPSDVCKVDPERFEEGETQITDETASDDVVLDDKSRLRFLKRDIRNLRRDEPKGSLPFILQLIDRRVELDERFSEIEANFERVESFLAAGALGALSETGLIPALASRTEEMGWTHLVRLSRFYMNGIGVPQDRQYAMQLILDQAYAGNADALLEVLRMQLRGDAPDTWTPSAEETALLAFGGLIGKTNRGLCHRAERMAREFIDGDLLTPNPDLAYAWRKFAADMGDADAAWRVVEYHLSATGEQKNEAILQHYLQQALENGAVVLPDTVDELLEKGVKTEDEIRDIIGTNALRVGAAKRLSAVPYLEMDVRFTTREISDDGEYLQYLREIAALDHVPASVLTRLAREIQLRRGRWDARDEIIALLEQAVDLGDPDAHLDLAKTLLLERHDPAFLNEAEALLMQAVERFGEARAMDALDRLYRCQVPAAPKTAEANFWADAYRAAAVSPYTISATDLAKLSPRNEPETIARTQSLALEGNGGALANLLQYLQSDRNMPEDVLRHWAQHVARSDVALEDYVLQEFELALTREERESAIELFRRAYLDIGSSISLELALVLLEHAGRDPEIASQIIEQLEISATRGEGSAIRMLQRLTKREPLEVIDEYAEIINRRGDFLANVFAASYAHDDASDMYMDRAVSLMNCNTKDVTELVEASSRRGDDEAVAHWVRVGLALEGGNTLTKHRLNDWQIENFNRGVSIAQDTVATDVTKDRDFDDFRRLFLATSDPEAPRFDPKIAAEQLAAIFLNGNRTQYLWALKHYRETGVDVRLATNKLVDVRTGLEAAAAGGDATAQFELGMLIRKLASNRKELDRSTEWLAKSANAGHGDAMFEYAYAIAFGIGNVADPKLALIWLDRAERLHPGKKTDLRNTLSAMVSE